MAALQWCPDQTAGETTGSLQGRCSSSSSFNGAPTKRPGKHYVAASAVVQRCGSFNGAPTKRPGKHYVAASAVVQRCGSFNGAPTKRPGKPCDEPPTEVLREPASMVPRPNGRGNPATRLTAAEPLKASMVPRPNGRGNFPPPSRPAPPPSSFNGAPTKRPGKHRSRRGGPGRSARFNGAPTKRPGKHLRATLAAAEARALQWCPDQTAGETSPSRLISGAYENSLQWCPDQTAGETAAAQFPQPPPPEASMVPRPNGRGNTPRPKGLSTRGKLASMVPRPNGRGNRGCRKTDQGDTLSASMVPRPNGRGNNQPVPVPLKALQPLQWCPDQTAGETARKLDPSASSGYVLDFEHIRKREDRPGFPARAARPSGVVRVR